MNKLTSENKVSDTDINIHSFCEPKLGELHTKEDQRICFIIDNFKDELFLDNGSPDPDKIALYLKYVEGKYQASIVHKIPSKIYDGKRYCAVMC